MITATQNEHGELLTLTITAGRRSRTYTAVELLEALAKADLPPTNVPSAPYVALDELLQRTAEHFRMPMKVITGKSRAQAVAQARFALVYAARRCGHTTIAIGQILGGRDHTTVVYGEERAYCLARTHAWFAKRLAAIMGVQA